MKLAVHQPMAKPILHTKFHQNRTMGCENNPDLSFAESKGSNPLELKRDKYIFFCCTGQCAVLQTYVTYSIVDPATLCAVGK